MAEFSKVTIEFLVNFQFDFEVTLSTTFNGQLTSNTWEWVTTRSAPYQVTTGLPTGILGERTAINFASAFNLDSDNLIASFETRVLADGGTFEDNTCLVGLLGEDPYIVNQTTNTVEIISKTEGLDFVGFTGLGIFGSLLRQGVHYNVTFENYVAPPDLTTIDFALVKSPHYINIPFLFDTTTSASVDVFVWDGDVLDVPTNPTYSLTIPRPTIDFAEFNIDIADLVKEQLEPKPTIQTFVPSSKVDSTSESVKWIKYVASYTDETESIADINGLFIATDGYGYYNEGANPTKPDDNILTNGRNRLISNNGVALLPFVNNGEIERIEIESKPNGDLNRRFDMVTLNFTKQIIQYIQLNLALSSSQDTDISVTTYPIKNTVKYKVIDECRYTPIQVFFKNKYGVFDALNLFKKQSHSTSTKHDTFVNNYITAGNYDTTRHQYQKLNVTAKDKIKTNSGYILEAENEIYKELLQSETVYFYENEKLIPVNLTNSSLDFKTQLDDKLFNYSLDFEYAYNVIQNV